MAVPVYLIGYLYFSDGPIQNGKVFFKTKKITNLKHQITNKSQISIINDQNP